MKRTNKKGGAAIVAVLIVIMLVAVGSAASFVIHSRLCDNCDILRCGIMIFVVQTACIHKLRAGKTKLLDLSVHKLNELLF